ncbi:hypothetical protein [Phytoactinopolyspora halotolerans]|uniref:PH domain-containing protein n=1 Tax=Phytoactinopolyspora halotolerans TaxID=1981512 RepID=A0A6L9SCX8_9ACTN|nr:hypothetical protein [Phytoactinopolyspora halotolerans]NEE01870.1 hypothetical protein [Phytoactinopolyspora halotolerans]
MRHPSVPAAARATRVRDMGPGVHHLLAWLTVCGFVGILFAAPLWLFVTDDVRNGVDVTTALWRPEHRALTIAATASAVVVLTLLTVALVRLPRTRARREIVVDADGVEIAERPQWWFRGRTARIGWENVQVISAASSGLGAAGADRALHLYVYRDVEGLPGFVASTPVREEDVDLEGVRIPSYLVRIYGPTPRAGEDVREVAVAIGAVRPGLFYAGVGVDQWYIPDGAPGAGAQPHNVIGRAMQPDAAPVSTEPDAGPDPLARAASPARPRPEPPPGAPVWLDYGYASWQIGIAVVVMAAAGAGMVYLMTNPFGWSTVPAGLLALVLVAPLLFCCLLLPAALWLFPRFTAGVGIRVDGSGLVIVRKRPWRLRGTVSTPISWDRIQLMVARSGSMPGVPVEGGGGGKGQRRRVVDVYLYDTAHDVSPDVPGVGVDLSISRRLLPDSAGMADLVTYPAVRLRLPYRHDLEPRGRERWDGSGRTATGGAFAVPPHQLRAALMALRPDMCHGFDDLWGGIEKR